MNKFIFGDIVVVEGNLVGVIVKSWGYLKPDNKRGSMNYDVYVRSYNGFKSYEEEDIERLTYDKELEE